MSRADFYAISTIAGVDAAIRLANRECPETDPQ
jgi:hypothetical protein